MPWNIYGDFNEIRNYSGIMNRQITFENTGHGVVISEIALCGFRNGEFKIFVYASNDINYRFLTDRIRAGGLTTLDDFESRTLRQFTVTYRVIMPNVLTFLQVVQESEPRFEEIREQINAILHITLPPIAPVERVRITVPLPAPRPMTPPPLPAGTQPFAGREKECGICFDAEPLNRTDPYDKVITICGHVFHRTELLRWQNTLANDTHIQNYNLCPLCRAELIHEDDDDSF